MCGRCNATHTTQCFADSDCSSVGTEYCETNRCRDGSYCTLWAYELAAGKAFLYRMIGNNRCTCRLDAEARAARPRSWQAL